MKFSASIKFTLTFAIAFFALPLIINALGGYTWEANIKEDTFTVARVITGIVLSILGYRFYFNKQKS